MGWSSGTEIFDTSIELFLENSDTPGTLQVDSFVIGMYDTLTDLDWDTVDESYYVDMLEAALNRVGQTLYEEG